MYSLGIAYGGVSTIGSYNNFKNNCFRDALIVVIMDCLTAIFAGIVVFSYLGFLAHQLDVPIGKFIEENGIVGPNLAFIAIPYAITKINYFYGCPQLLAFLSFFMFLLVGFGSLYMFIEVVLNALDQITVRFLSHLALVVERVPEFLGTRPEPDFFWATRTQLFGIPILPEPNLTFY